MKNQPDRKEKSFFLLKPDLLNNQDGLKLLYVLIDEKNLEIVSRKELLLDEKDVNILWPYCEYDPVCHWLMKDYVVGKKLYYFDIEGTDAVKKMLTDKETNQERLWAKPIL